MEALRQDLLSALPASPAHDLQFFRLTPKCQELMSRPFHHRELELEIEDTQPNPKPIPRFVAFSLYHAELGVDPDALDLSPLMGLVQNVALLARIYPDFRPLVYVDETSLRTFPALYTHFLLHACKIRADTLVLSVRWSTKLALATAKQLGAKHQLPLETHCDLAYWLGVAARREKAPADPIMLQHLKALYTLIPSGFRVVCLARDPAARVNVREARAVFEWLATGYSWHRLTDTVLHPSVVPPDLWASQPRCYHVVGATETTKTQKCDTQCVATPDLPLMLRHLFRRQALHQPEKVWRDWRGIVSADVMVHGMARDAQRVEAIGHRLDLLLPYRPAGLASDWREHVGGHGNNHDVGLYTAFCGEKIMVGASADEETMDVLLRATVNAAHGKELPQLHDLITDNVKMDPARFLEKYHWDPRAWPRHWYCWERIILFPALSGFAVSDGALVASESELRLLNTLFMEAARHESKVAAFLAQHVDDDSFRHDYVPYLLKNSQQLKTSEHGADALFAHVHQQLKTRSAVWSSLSRDEKTMYWAGVLTFYLYSSAREG